MREDNKLYKAAKRRAYAKIGFYIHLAVYVFVIAALAIVNLAFTPQFLWFLFPATSWGLGVAIQGFVVFIALDADLKRRLIEKEMRRLREASEPMLEESGQNYAPLNWRDA